MATVGRKHPVRFVVKPGQEEVVAEFAEFNIASHTRTMATTSIKSKNISSTFDLNLGSVGQHVFLGTNMQSQNVNTSQKIPFDASNHRQFLEAQMALAGRPIRREFTPSQPRFVDAIHTTATTLGSQQLQSNLEGQANLTGSIILVPRDGVL